MSRSEEGGDGSNMLREGESSELIRAKTACTEQAQVGWERNLGVE